MTASQWNAMYPPGTPVRYRPLPRFPDEYVDTRTAGAAYEIQPHHACVMLQGRRGTVTLAHLEVLPLPLPLPDTSDVPEHVAELHEKY